MEIVDNRTKKEEWHLGDVLVSKFGNFAVTITLIADAKQLDLNTLNKISLNSLTVDFTSVQTELLPEPKKVEDK